MTDRKAFSPQAIMELAKKNPLLRSCLMEWEQGNLTWEEMLQLAVVHLAAQNEQMAESHLRNLREAPTPVVLARPHTPGDRT